MTTKIAPALALAGVLAVGGCGQQGSQTDGPEPVDTAAATAASDTYLPTPFTADQIRDEWIQGFELVMRRSSPEGEYLERWRVVAADEDGVEIEFTPVDALGEVIGEPRLQRSGWEELRDHARFPTDRATRTWVVETTPLGELEGWLYSVDEPDDSAVAHFFFAQGLPGAPVYLRVVSGDATILELAQLERFRPPAPGRG